MKVRKCPRCKEELEVPNVDIGKEFGKDRIQYGPAYCVFCGWKPSGLEDRSDDHEKEQGGSSTGLP